MSVSFTKLFSSITESTLWVNHSHTVRIVWITMLAMADRDGIVSASIPGLARRACVSVAETEEALEAFMAPDPYSRSREHEGRRIEEVDGGWVLLNHAKYRAIQSAEGERERKAQYMRDRRAKEGKVLPFPLPVAKVAVGNECSSASASASASASGSDPDPEGVQGEPERDTEPAPPPPPRPVEAQGMPTVWRTLDGWEPSDGLRGYAVAVGVPAEDFDRRVADLRNGPIGGSRGVLDRDAYVRSQFGKWRTWGETDRAKAQRDAQAPPGARLGRGGSGVPMLEASAKHERYAAKHGLDLGAVLRAMAEEGIVDKLGLGRAREIIGERLAKLARERGAS